MAKAPRKKPVPRTVKPQSGTFQEKLQEARTRPYKGTKGGTPARVEKPRATGRQYSGPTQRMGGPARGVDTFRPVPLRDKPLGLEGPKPQTGGRGIRATSLMGGPVGIAAQVLLTSATPAGEGSDKPKGPLMQGTRMRTRPEYPGSYPKGKPRVTGGARPEVPGSYPKRSTGAARPETPGRYPAAKATPKAKAPRPKARPSVAPSQQGSGKVTKTPETRFKGNWVGATPTEMQKRAGQKNKRPNLLSLLRNRRER